MFDTGGDLEQAGRPPAEPEHSQADSQVDLHAMPAGALGKDLVELSDQIGRRNLALCRRLAVFESKSGHELDGQRTAGSWLAHHTGMSRSAAGHLVKIARRLRDLPVLAAAAEAGELSWEQTKLLALAATEATFDLFVEIEADLVDACRHLDIDGTRLAVDRWRKLADQAAEKALDGAQNLGRQAYLSSSLDGVCYLNATLDPESGRILETALARLMDAHRRHETAGDETLPEDQRTTPQRRHDALVDMARLACGWNPKDDAPVEDVIIDGIPRPTVELVVDLDTLRTDGVGELCEYIDRGLLPIETARRLSCECTIGRVLTAKSLPVDLGRQTRTPSRAVRRALELRDGGCAFPGCGQHPRLCHAHHIEHWADHGETEPENLVLVCWFHHRLVHEGGWNVTISHDTSRPVFHAPDGRTFNATRPRPELPKQLTARFRPNRE